MSNYAIIGLAILAVYLIFLAFSFVLRKKDSLSRAYISMLYKVGLAYIIAQGIFYTNALPNYSPDEMAHISYIYHIEQTHELIPHFEDMHLFKSEVMKWSVSSYEYSDALTNYLCHPSLYYHIMQLAGGLEDIEPGVVVDVDLMKLRYFSLGISILGIALLLYIGWSRISKDEPWLHMLYITSVTCIPIMCLEMCGVTNDSLAILTTSLCVLGLIRFCEDKRNFATYLMISGGITLSFLNKMTAAMLCVVMALIVLFVTIIKEQCYENSLKREFWLTTPLFILPLIYLWVIYQRYGVLQPTLKVISSPEYFQSSFFYVPEADRPAMSALSYIGTYFNNFFLSWAGLVTDDMSIRKVSPFAISTVPMELLWIIPALAFTKWVRKAADKLTLPIIAGWFSILITFGLQLKKAYGNFISNGYTGGSQARYYLPLISVFGLAAVYAFAGITDSDNNKYIRRIGYLAAFLYSLLLFYGNFPFFLMHN